MKRRLLEFIILPAEITPFEREYLGKINRIALYVFVLHLPVLTAIALLAGTGPGLAAGLCSLTLAGPVCAHLGFKNPRHVSLVLGLTSVFMGGLLVHFGQGQMQIEMHFYFFVSLALMSVFANPAVILLASLAVALHHVLFFFLLPRSVFNYQASLWAVGVHAIFVVMAAVATCFIARSFFDNVVGLERLIMSRTQELHSRNRDLRLVLDSVDQGFLTASTSGVLAAEHSRIIESWLGPVLPGMHLWEYLGAKNAGLRRELKESWQSLGDGLLSVDEVLSILPRRMGVQGLQLQLDYKRIEPAGSFLIVVSDITAQLDRQRIEDEQRELVHIFQELVNDRAGFLEFFDEAQALVMSLSNPSRPLPGTEAYRAVHTLKGNAVLFGVSSVATVCHELERQLQDGGGLDAGGRARLTGSWEEAAARINRFIGKQGPPKLTADEDEHLGVLAALRAGADRHEVARTIEAWKHEPAGQRLNRIAEQANALALRVGKGPIDVRVEAGQLRLPQPKWADFWASFVHVVRNAVDHGLEERDERLLSGKPERGQLRLKLESMSDQVRLTISDDGRGVDWAAVRQTALGRGMPVATRAQLEEALFCDGFTTKVISSDLSGQGIGLGAARAACQRMGGTARIRSEPGRGTEVEFWFPHTICTAPSRQLAALVAQPAGPGDDGRSPQLE